jgi:WD repeat-containing protein 48
MNHRVSNWLLCSRYSAGRDGLICSWDIGADLSNPKAHGDGRPTLPPTTFREEIQAHNHWINDIALCYSNEAVVSCSSDLKVKLWRPQSTQGSYLIGHHTDYVKCLAAPSVHSDWVASAGLDRTVRVWDLNTASEKLKMNVKAEDDKTSHSNLSIYSLAVGMEGSIIASGGPEKVVRLWDARSGEKIGKFIGHTDNIRSILVSEQNGIVVTASTDKTIKFWSIPQNRCLQTLSMHNESVWSLYSDHPTLDIFYSSDRSGMVVKTDIRNVTDLGDDRSVNNEGLCLNIAQDNEAINKAMPCGGYIWTASASSGIKRWLDVDTDAELVFPETPKADRRPRVTSSASTRPRGFTASSAGGASFTAHSRPTIPRTALMRMIERSTRSSNVRDPDAVTVYSVTSGRQQSVAETLMETEETPTVPFNERPQETTAGARGLLKHHVLNDRRRCLTVDTEGEVEMWDLITCVPIKNFGKRHLDDVVMEVNTLDQISNWSTVNCQTGRLAVLLEENSCFDSEQYWDEAGISEHIEVPADQRSQ